jgi:hypothetical protein
MFRCIFLGLLLWPSLFAAMDFHFSTDNAHWLGDFADYPVGEEHFYELSWGWENLPYPIDQSGKKIEKGLFLSGNNHSDDLFMFAKRKITRLEPDTTYALDFEVVFESNTPVGSIGIGGSPGESVYFKVGASTEEPKKVAIDGFYYMNVDKGNQAQGGKHAIVIGDLSNPNVDAEHPSYFPKELRTNRPMNIKSNRKGELWIFLGTDSGFEGPTKFYLAEVNLQATAIK